ncbi:hypothetical protein JAAARDRAFT_191620 [Jaapia argillacea MUCL 33604]|uniref:DUF6533 domain-containing protein n=1 Tax=Jaapia argillacea MUCL 33604 TaxID=933084 RepID=A0A067PZS0_9AGAM|nr:hypothetical protein JAAARDRAFT_191620 [Jaapia argillacea MUCL 33604]
MAAEETPLAGLVGQINLTQSCQLAAALITIYDHVTTFDQEVNITLIRSRHAICV